MDLSLICFVLQGIFIFQWERYTRYGPCKFWPQYLVGKGLCVCDPPISLHRVGSRHILKDSELAGPSSSCSVTLGTWLTHGDGSNETHFLNRASFHPWYDIMRLWSLGLWKREEKQCTAPRLQSHVTWAPHLIVCSLTGCSLQQTDKNIPCFVPGWWEGRDLKAVDLNNSFKAHGNLNPVPR